METSLNDDINENNNDIINKNNNYDINSSENCNNFNENSNNGGNTNDYNFNDNINEKNNETESLNTSEVTSIQQFWDEYLKLFSCENKEELIDKLKELDHDAESICARVLDNEGGWKCSDCEKNDNSIICHQCWSKIKSKHENHNIKYHYLVKGTCDCGDLNTVEETLFCPQHKGPLTKEEDILKFINKSFTPEFIQNFEKITEHLILVFLFYINGQDQNADISTEIENFINIIDVLSNNNAIIHILSKIFLKNFKLETKHNCLLVNDNEFKFVMKENEVHICECPFIRYLMEFWVNGNQDILYRFLLNYKLRKTMGILYFILYENFEKSCIEDFCELSIQYILEDICKTVSSIPGIMNFYFESINKLIKLVIYDYKNSENESLPISQRIAENDSDNSKYIILKEIISNIYYDALYLIKTKSAKILGSNQLIYFKLIETLSEFHNINSAKYFYPHVSGFYKEIFNKDLINIEYYILEMFDLYISILNFENQELIQSILNYFSDVIINATKNFQLDDNNYSFHYSLYRGFSIFLIKYCFHFIYYNGIDDLNEGFKNAIQNIRDFNIIREIIVNDYYKLFGLLNACGENILSYYGEFMPNYERVYLENNNFILRDFALMKFLLSSNDFHSSFSLLNIYKKCSLENTYNIMEKYFFSNDSKPENDFLEKNDNDKYMNFNGKILKFILNLIRDNTSFLFGLGSSCNFLSKSKIPNEIVKSIFMNDKDSIKEICKKLIINQIMSEENLAPYIDIKNNIYESIWNIFGEDKIEDLIVSLTNKTLTQNKKAKFSLKDEYLKNLDITSVYNYENESNIVKYINNFKKEKLSIYNTYFYPFTKYEINLQNNIFHNFFINQENFDIIFKLTELLLTEEKYIIFQKFFLSQLINYWNIFFYIFQDDNNQTEEYKLFINKNKQTIQKLINILMNESLDDISLKDYCMSVIEKITKNNLLIDLEINKDNNTKKENKAIILKKSLLKKMKIKYKKKNKQLEKFYKTESFKVDLNIYEPCIYCLKPIEPNNINNLYGKVGNLLNDFLFFNGFSQTLKNEFGKYCKDEELLLTILSKKDKKYSYFIYSCNHFIHNSCYIKLSTNATKCPLCKRKINLFIPHLSNYINNKDSYGLFKGVNLLHKEQTTNLKDNNKFDISMISKEEKKKIQDICKTKFDELIILSKQFMSPFTEDFDFYFIEPSKRKDKISSTQKIIDIISCMFSDFFDLIENFDNIDIKIENYKNIILVIRLFLKLDILDYETIFNILIKLLNKLLYFNNETNFIEIIFENDLKRIFSQILIIISILFDYESIIGYEKNLINLILPIYSIQYYIREILICSEFQFNFNIFKQYYNPFHFKEFLKKNKNAENIIKYIIKNIKLTNKLIGNDKDFDTNINKILDKLGFSNDKLEYFIDKIFMPDFCEDRAQKNNKTIDLFFSQFLPKKKIYNFFGIRYYLIFMSYSNKKKQFINPNLLCSCLPIIYNFIELPKFALDFQYNFFNVPCYSCERIGCPSLICLTCKTKICCTKEDICGYFDLFLDHNDECGGGRSIYISSDNYKIMLMNDEGFLEMEIPLYVNKFGESIDGYITSKDIILNEEEIKMAFKSFINYSWINKHITD